jgi:hypothetical protein
VHLTPWLSVFGNYALGFNPTSGNLYIDGNMLPSASSHGTDLGLKLFLLKDHVSISMEHYQSFESNQSAGISGNIRQYMNNIANANVRGDYSVEGRNQRDFPNVPTQFYDTRDRSNKGYEFELTANLTHSWRLMMNAAFPEAYQQNAFAYTREFLKKNDALLRQILLDAGVLVDANGSAYKDPTITDPAQMSPDAGSALSAWGNVRDWVKNLAVGQQKITRLMDYSANIFTDYRFHKGWLNGFSIGAGANFRGREVLGYRGSDLIANPNAPTKAIDDPTVDEYDVVWNRGYHLITATMGYRCKLRHGLTLDIQFRVFNLLNEGWPRYYTTSLRPPGGSLTTPARIATGQQYALLTPRSFTLSSTLSF